jgi:hypothetical protein
LFENNTSYEMTLKRCAKNHLNCNDVKQRNKATFFIVNVLAFIVTVLIQFHGMLYKEKHNTSMACKSEAQALSMCVVFHQPAQQHRGQQGRKHNTSMACKSYTQAFSMCVVLRQPARQSGGGKGRSEAKNIRYVDDRSPASDCIRSKDSDVHAIF